jgi:MGT family glycosyltransferase
MTANTGGSGKRVLFLPYSKILAHAGRSVMVAQSLRERCNGAIAFAGPGGYAKLIEEAGFPFYNYGDEAIDRMHSRYYDPYLRRRDARPSLKMLLTVGKEIVHREVELCQAFKPDVIVWDGLPSALISADILAIPVIGIVHAFHTPYSTVKPALPRTLPLSRLVQWVPQGIEAPIATILMKVLRLLVLMLINRLRVAFHLEPLKSVDDVFRRLRAVIMPDLEILGPTANRPNHFHYVGPLVWQPLMEVPAPLKTLQGIIYVTMGSTGDLRAFAPLLQALSRMPEIPAVIALGDLLEREKVGKIPKNVHVYRYLPGTEMAKRARLVIYHGGAGTMYQALSQGVPVIGIPFTPVQELVGIKRLEELGAGRRLSPGDLTPERLAKAITEILKTDSFQKAAQHIAGEFRLEEGPKRTADIILKELADANSPLFRQ